MRERGRNILISFINVVVGIVQIFLVLRLILRFFAANPQAPFVSWVYSMSEPLLHPFSGMFPSPVIERGMILEFSTLFAIIIYALISWLLIEFIYFIYEATRREPPKVETTKETTTVNTTSEM